MPQVHATAKWMLGFIGYYGLAAAPPITAIVVCLAAVRSYDQPEDQHGNMVVSIFLCFFLDIPSFKMYLGVSIIQKAPKIMVDDGEIMGQV